VVKFSTDPAIKEAAGKSMRDAIDAATHEDAVALQRHLASIAAALRDENEQIRLSASGIFYLLSQFHEDSAAAIAPSIPTLLTLTRDRNEQLRANVFRALGYLRPTVPPEVVVAMHDFVRDPNSTARGMAAFVIATSFMIGSDDERLLERLLSDPQPLIRRTAVEAVGLAMGPGYIYGARPAADTLIEILRQRLSDPDVGEPGEDRAAGMKGCRDRRVNLLPVATRVR
jgi:HEAT repeat protein